MVEEVKDEDSPRHLSARNNEGTGPSQSTTSGMTSSTAEKPKVCPLTEERHLADTNYLSGQLQNATLSTCSMRSLPKMQVDRPAM